jgi:hypothetical protein
LDRHTGDVLWQRIAEFGFHHNSIIVASDMVYCIDRMPPLEEDALRRHGVTAEEPYRILALDVRNGREVWTTEENVFGTWLACERNTGILIQSGRKSPDMVTGEPTGRIIAYRSNDGAVLWDKQEDIDDGPYLLSEDRIYMQNSQYNMSNALELKTGKEVLIKHRLTGETIPWHFLRAKGCNYIIGCKNLLTFRSGTAAYYDLTCNGGIGHLGGFKSGCTSNLVPANGVLSAPDYTRTCNCSYPNQTSLALVHMPGVEIWTLGAAPDPAAPIERVGINFGAPGDRVAENGTLWLEYPIPEYGDSVKQGDTYPNIDVVTKPNPLDTFRDHSIRYKGEDLLWVAASGAMGVRDVVIPLGGDEDRTFRVRLVFAEPETIAEGQRLFSVRIQGREVLADFDIVQAAGGIRRSVIREFRDVKAKDDLRVALIPTEGASKQAPILCGIEVIEESAIVQ